MITTRRLKICELLLKAIAINEKRISEIEFRISIEDNKHPVHSYLFESKNSYLHRINKHEEAIAWMKNRFNDTLNLIERF
jgi:hypothetical protein